MQTSSSSPLQTLLDLINETLSLLLRTSLTVRSFPSRWHPLRSDRENLTFFNRDLFTRLQIGGVEFKNKALESLLQLLQDDDKAAGLVAKEGNVAYLIHLLDFHTRPWVREQATSAVSLLAAANDESRKAVFEEGGLGPLLRILESGTTTLKEKAAIAVEALTADPENAWAVSAYGGEKRGEGFALIAGKE